MTSHGGKRRGAGRPVLPPEQRKVQIGIRVAPDVAEWLRGQSDGVSVTIEKLVRESLPIGEVVTLPDKEAAWLAGQVDLGEAMTRVIRHEMTRERKVKTIDLG